MTITVVLKSDICKGVPDKWAMQYAQYPAASGFAEISRQLKALDVKDRVASRLNQIVGNDGWTANECDECGADFEVLIRIGDEPDYDARWVDLCAGCLAAAARVLNAADKEG